MGNKSTDYKTRGTEMSVVTHSNEMINKRDVLSIKPIFKVSPSTSTNSHHHLANNHRPEEELQIIICIFLQFFGDALYGRAQCHNKELQLMLGRGATAAAGGG